MNLDSFREFCLAKKGVTEETPFGPDALVYKVKGKMFALVGIDNHPLVISLKNTPEKNEELRAEYDGITGAFHMNKRHWNSVIADARIKDPVVKELITESYDLVVKSLPKKTQEELKKE
ncbi:MmcQ/YjbR family DNA-binding protein [Emticicia sp. TH156]|uniref:MmcQ/YjbR family DNA-binding protein n=1 Tax=Emticicia sp. TH156 TaxID=2067454 RepID=UPI000C757ED6|nr:MmcQ/YjbR family DNA-binding protein [Emticicia sp. TH156]PLK43615.1 MmcQ-like protein [Emticicia sp. TH156]